MSSLSSVTRGQWIVIIVLELATIALYFGVIPWAVSSMGGPAPSPTEEVAELSDAETPPATPLPGVTPSPTKRRPTPSPTVTDTPTPTATSVPTATSAPTARPAPVKMAASTLAELVANPRVSLTSKTTFFSSVCFGDNANPLQDRDFMAPADWSSSPDRKCIYGYNVNPVDGMPVGRYMAGGGADGQPRFYIIPPEAFAQDQQSIKALTQIQIIVDLDAGCGSLGFLGIVADGITYQIPACDFLKPGAIAPNIDGSHTLVLPTNDTNIFNSNANGGAYGFVGFPAVIFRRGLAVYFTGRAGYAPPRTWFESAVDTFRPNVNVKTTVEMTSQEVKAIATQFDRVFAGTEPKSLLAPFERELAATSPSPVSVRSKEKGSIDFAATPGTVLSSVAWRVTPLNNQDKIQFLETNLCLDLNGEEDCFTGVEDFAHCAFFTPCITGYSALTPVDHGGYIATRYFPAGMAPVIRDGHITAKFMAPDNGAVLEMQVKIRVRDVNTTP